jgi:hypothetical protein
MSTDDDVTTGTDLIRSALRIRNVKQNLARVARDHEVALILLDAFIAGRATLPVPILQSLTRELFPHAEFDPSTDRLRPALQEPPRLMGIPPTFTIPLPKYQLGAVQCAHRPENEAAPAKPKKRAGWLGGWV